MESKRAKILAVIATILVVAFGILITVNPVTRQIFWEALKTTIKHPVLI